MTDTNPSKSIHTQRKRSTSASLPQYRFPSLSPLLTTSKGKKQVLARSKSSTQLRTSTLTTSNVRDEALPSGYKGQNAVAGPHDRAIVPINKAIFELNSWMSASRKEKEEINSKEIDMLKDIEKLKMRMSAIFSVRDVSSLHNLAVDCKELIAMRKRHVSKLSILPASIDVLKAFRSAAKKDKSAIEAASIPQDIQTIVHFFGVKLELSIISECIKIETEDLTRRAQYNYILENKEETEDRIKYLTTAYREINDVIRVAERLSDTLRSAVTPIDDSGVINRVDIEKIRDWTHKIREGPRDSAYKKNKSKHISKIDKKSSTYALIEYLLNHDGN